MVISWNTRDTRDSLRKKRNILKFLILIDFQRMAIKTISCRKTSVLK